MATRAASSKTRHAVLSLTTTFRLPHEGMSDMEYLSRCVCVCVCVCVCEPPVACSADACCRLTCAAMDGCLLLHAGGLLSCWIQREAQEEPLLPHRRCSVRRAAISWC